MVITRYIFPSRRQVGLLDEAGNVAHTFQICDRVAVLADKKVIAVDTVPNLLDLDHEWIQQYFNGPRGRAALTAQALDELRRHMDEPVAAHAVKALDKANSKKDKVSHYALRLAYCRTESLRRQFLTSEVQLFKARFKAMKNETKAKFIRKELHYTSMEEEEFKKLKNDLGDVLAQSKANFGPIWGRKCWKTKCYCARVFQQHTLDD